MRWKTTSMTTSAIAAADEDEEAYYDVCCPNCNEEFCVDEETLLEGGIECPGCGEHLEFGDIECDDECGCGCHDHDHTDE